MKTSMYWCVLALSLVCFSTSSELQAEDSAVKPPFNTRKTKVTLHAGDPAPQLLVGKWLNGEPVNSFEKGKVYVIECWATWCVPCVEAIPELSQLNTYYKDKNVVFIGLNSYDGDQTLIEPFVKKMGAKMNYRVAIDKIVNNQAQSLERWMEAAGIHAIPCTFVVDRQGLIAWIGHPGALPDVLSRVVAGTFDGTTQLKLQDANTRFEAAAKAEDGDAMLKIVDEIAQLDPTLNGEMDGVRFKVLLLNKKEYAKAYEMGERAAGGVYKNNPQGLNEISWTVLDSPGVEKRDYDLALKWVTRADELTQHADSMILDTLARAHFEKGNIDKAVEIETLAIQKLTNPKYKDEFARNLERYKLKNR